jgi:uncharacterized membrane protein
MCPESEHATDMTARQIHNFTAAAMILAVFFVNYIFVAFASVKLVAFV